MPEMDAPAVFDAVGEPPTESHAEDERAARDDAIEDVADRRARAARIRQRSLELIEALGADHPLVTEALARADALDRATTAHESTRVGAHRAPDGDGSDAVDLRSSADLSR